MLNIIGRTKIQQEKKEAKLLKQGSLWPKFKIFDFYVFSRKELNDVKKAQKIIANHKEKRSALL